MRGFPARSQEGTRKLAILGYHKIGDPPPDWWWSWYYIPEETFAGHLSYLRESGWEVIDLLALLKSLTEPESLPERTALLTFDDGYRSMGFAHKLEAMTRSGGLFRVQLPSLVSAPDFWCKAPSMNTVTLPLLLRFGCPAVLFVPTDYIGGLNDFDAGNEPEEAICDWDDLRELERSGVSIQSHGATHRSFSELDLAGQEEELTRSKAALEAGLEKPIEVFAYPYGDGGTEPRATGRVLERAGYRAACLYKGGPISLPIAESHRLTRVAMGPDTDLLAELEQG